MARLWDLLAVTFALLAAWAGSSAPRGEGIVAAIPFVIGALLFGGLALRAHKRREEKSKQLWAKEYAQNLYDAFVVRNDLGNITALKLKIPTALHAVYQNKIVLQRELISFVALMSVANPESGLGPVMLAYENLVTNKMAKRGLQMSGDQLAKAVIEDVEAMKADRFKWAQEWLAEFGDNARDNFIPFGEHCVRLFDAYSAGIEKTRPRERGLKRKAKMWRESLVAGATNTGNVTATVGNKLVLNWHGTPTQRDGVLQMFPVIRDKSFPGVELGSCADAIIASIHDEGMSPDKVGSNIQTLAMLWRVFTTRLDDGTYGDLIAHTNMHATFELHEQPNDQFKITWKISVMKGERHNGLR